MMGTPSAAKYSGPTASNPNHGLVRDSASDCSSAPKRPIHTLDPRKGGTASGDTLMTPDTERRFAITRSCATKFVVSAHFDHTALSAAVTIDFGWQSTAYCRHGSE